MYFNVKIIDTIILYQHDNYGNCKMLLISNVTSIYFLSNTHLRN